MANFEEKMLDAIDILIQQRVSNLQFDKTVRARISEIVTSDIGEYKVSYQNSLFLAYSLSPEEQFEIGDEVFVQVHSSDFRKNPTILGLVKRLGDRYAFTLQIEDRFEPIGANVLAGDSEYGFCSYKNGGTAIQVLNNSITVDSLGFDLYKQEAEYLRIGADFRTNLPLEQQVGSGNYGMIVQCQYYNPNIYKSYEQQDNDFATTGKDNYIYIPYVLDVNNMIGQPYNFFTGSRQTAIFPINGKDLKGIKSISLFSKDFPNTITIQTKVWEKNGILYGNAAMTYQVSGYVGRLYVDQLSPRCWAYDSITRSFVQKTDIWISNLQFTFVDQLSEEDLQGSNLRIITPYGAYFNQSGQERALQAVVKFNGKKIDADKAKVKFYWFIKDNSVFNGHQLYSQYGGSGWRCLNSKEIVEGYQTFVPDTSQKVIRESQCPNKITEFKCVAILEENIFSNTCKLYNLTSAELMKITSSAGTSFDFGLGTTDLECSVDGTDYYWMYSYDGGPLMRDSRNQKKLEDVTVLQAKNYLYYQVTVYNGTDYLGSANITLYNKTENLDPFNVHIKNKTQIFKYDNYGVSPASKTKEEWDRMIIPDLSFDIYTSEGKLVQFTDDEKQRALEIRWIVPENNTMLIVNNTQYETVLPAVGESYNRKVLKNRANLSFSIQNKYDTSKTNNDIILQVTYQGYKIMDTTNFTFTKEGEIGSNGTKYIARLVPNDDNVEEVYFVGGYIRSWSYGPNGTYLIRQTYNRTPSLKMQIWDGGDAPIFDGDPYNATNNKNAWSLVHTGRTNRPAYRITEAGVVSQYTNITSADYKSGIVQGTYSSNQLSDLARDYHATYPLMHVYGGSYQNSIVTGGYRFCMFENDGSRSSFSQSPFTFKLIKNDRTVDTSINENDIVWQSSWGGKIKDTNGNLLTGGAGNNVYIEPPGHYPEDGNVNQYITCTYKNSTTIYISVHFYMNRYGLDAINSWDGNSIKINKQGDQYILAPQIGAGQKDAENRFTGITIGKSFNVSGAGSKEIGMMGFHEGARTLFLDAETGNSVFGKSGSAQIVIGPAAYGVAPAASIYSSNYFNYTNGKPASLKNQGMLIDLDTPAIKWGNGNFVVDGNGHLTAKGGGSIAGWKITNTELISPDNNIFLNSANGKIYGKGKNASGVLQNHDTLNATGEGFYLAPDGMSIGSTFFVDNTGQMRLGINAVRGTTDGNYWTIYGGKWKDGNGNIQNYSGSNISFGRYGKDKSVYIGTDVFTLGSKFYANNNGELRIGYGAVANSGKFWTINATSGANANSYISYGTRGQYNSVYIATNEICLGNIFRVGTGSSSSSVGELKLGYGAVSGSGAHWTIAGSSSQSYIAYNTTAFNATSGGSYSTPTINSSAGNNQVYIGTNGIRLGSKAAIDNYGNATFNNVKMSGTINATGGTVGGWTVGSNYIRAGNIYLRSDGSMSGGSGTRTWYINADGSAKFNGLDVSALKVGDEDILDAISRNTVKVYNYVTQGGSNRSQAYWAAWCMHQVGFAITMAFTNSSDQTYTGSLLDLSSRYGQIRYTRWLALYLRRALVSALTSVPANTVNYWDNIMAYLNQTSGYYDTNVYYWAGNKVG